MDRTRKPPLLRPALVKLIRANLTRLRAERGYTLDELAERAGVSGTAVRKLEYGPNNPSLATLDALAHALGVSLTTLLSSEK